MRFFFYSRKKHISLHGKHIRSKKLVKQKLKIHSAFGIALFLRIGGAVGATVCFVYQFESSESRAQNEKQEMEAIRYRRMFISVSVYFSTFNLVHALPLNLTSVVYMYVYIYIRQRIP